MKIRFSVVENTDGMIGSFVEVYFKQFSFIITDAFYITVYQYQNVAVFSSNQHVDKLATLQFLWTSASDAVDNVIYELD